MDTTRCIAHFLVIPDNTRKRDMAEHEYVKLLKKRRRESRVYREYQLAGLEIAEILGDRGHAALYIKLAKERNGRELLRLAKEIAEKKEVKNRGAYFMRIVTAQTYGRRNSHRS